MRKLRNTQSHWKALFFDECGEATVTCLICVLFLMSFATIILNSLIQMEQANAIYQEFESVTKCALSGATNKFYMIDYQGMSADMDSAGNLTTDGSSVGSGNTGWYDDSGTFHSESYTADRSSAMNQDVYDKKTFIRMLYDMYEHDNGFGEADGRDFTVSYNAGTGNGTIATIGSDAKSTAYSIRVTDTQMDTQNGYVSMVLEITLSNQSRVFDYGWPEITAKRMIRVRDSRVDYNYWKSDLSESSVQLSLEQIQSGTSLDSAISGLQSESLHNTSAWFDRNYIGSTTTDRQERAVQAGLWNRLLGD